jgi:hypothetical protein
MAAWWQGFAWSLSRTFLHMSLMSNLTDLLRIIQWWSPMLSYRGIWIQKSKIIQLHVPIQSRQELLLSGATFRWCGIECTRAYHGPAAVYASSVLVYGHAFDWAFTVCWRAIPSARCQGGANQHQYEGISTTSGLRPRRSLNHCDLFYYFVYPLSCWDKNEE